MPEFTIPGKPVGKGRPRATARGGFVRLYTPETTVEWERTVRLLAAQSVPDNWSIDGCYTVLICIRRKPPMAFKKAKRQQLAECHMPAPGKPDLDNVAKSILDAMNGETWRDDSQVTSLFITSQYAEEHSVTVHYEEQHG
jgi:Holliday junction resolvase RusA-like endonuclease